MSNYSRILIGCYYDPLEDRHKDDVGNDCLVSSLYKTNRFHVTVCLFSNRSRCQNVVRSSVTHSAIALCATFLFLPHFGEK